MQHRSLEELTIQRAKLEAQLKAIDVPALREKTFDRVFGVFTESPIRPETAPFVVGRVFEAFQDFVQVRDLEAKVDALHEKIRAIEDAKRGLEIE